MRDGQTERSGVWAGHMVGAVERKPGWSFLRRETSLRLLLRIHLQRSLSQALLYRFSLLLSAHVWDVLWNYLPPPFLLLSFHSLLTFTLGFFPKTASQIQCNVWRNVDKEISVELDTVFGLTKTSHDYSLFIFQHHYCTSYSSGWKVSAKPILKYCWGITLQRQVKLR